MSLDFHSLSCFYKMENETPKTKKVKKADAERERERERHAHTHTHRDFNNMAAKSFENLIKTFRLFWQKDILG